MGDPSPMRPETREQYSKRSKNMQFTGKFQETYENALILDMQWLSNYRKALVRSIIETRAILMLNLYNYIIYYNTMTNWYTPVKYQNNSHNQNHPLQRKQTKQKRVLPFLFQGNKCLH